MNIKKYLCLLLSLLILIGIVLFFVSNNRKIDLKKSSLKEKPKRILNENLSPISGMPCVNFNRRPFAVMLAEDEVARPLSGLTSADLVFEMPVLITGMNRMMAIYVCGNPEEIGSVRSARHDFIPIAMGFDAILAHWGGSHFALDKLNNGIMDNINALIYSGSVFWRQKNIAPPHNGFTNIERLYNKASQLGYRLKNKFEGYPHRGFVSNNQKTKVAPATLIIGYPEIHKVTWKYNPKTNDYLRWRGESEEKDFNNQNQVRAKNIVIMRAKSHPLENQYIDVDIEGSGDAEFYLNGKVIVGTWEKEAPYKSTKLYFYDKSGKEIKFEPGQIWIEVVGPDKKVVYTKD